MSIDHALWPALRVAFNNSDLVWHESAQFLSAPSDKLVQLYQTCFGDEWEDAVFNIWKITPLKSLDVFVALVGAAIQSEVFLSIQSWERKEPITFQSALHKELAAEMLREKGKVSFERSCSAAHLKLTVHDKTYRLSRSSGISPSRRSETQDT